LRWLFRYLKIDSEKTRLNSEDDHQFTPLVHAVKNRLFNSKNWSLEDLELLLDNSSRVNSDIIINYAVTALHIEVPDF
jgi:hypothetical protein